jgi:N-acylneuraminate cytidylyltransferase
LTLPVIQGINDKPVVLRQYLEEHHFDPQHVVYVGNDVNDLPCFPVVGCAVAPVDAEPEILRQADLVLSRKGGHGAVREICDLIVQRMN